MSLIERSPGIPIAASGFIAGGGHSGASQRLDDLVQSGAEALSDLYAYAPVMIRFNSDRHSGGAWLKTAERDYVGGNAEVGLRAVQPGVNIPRFPSLFVSLRRIALAEEGWEIDYADRIDARVCSVEEAMAFLRRTAVLDFDVLVERIATLTKRKHQAG